MAAGCMGATEYTNSELILYDDCAKAPAHSITNGWAYNETTNQIYTKGSSQSGPPLCIAAFLNGTEPKPVKSSRCSTQRSNIYLLSRGH